MNKKKRVLFICTHNSCRSQMAEGILRHLFSDYYEVHSAGIEVSEVNPYAIEVLREIGIDISAHFSKSIQKFKDKSFDYVVTVCDSLKEKCPVFFKGENFIHKGFTDPSKFIGGEAERLTVFRIVRDEIKEWIEKEFSPKN